MRRLGERPFDVEITSQANNDDTLAFLRNAIICCVDELVCHIVFYSAITMALIDSLQNRIILTPVFGIKFYFGIGKL